jgi:hypothetical protein
MNIDTKITRRVNWSHCKQRSRYQQLEVVDMRNSTEICQLSRHLPVADLFCIHPCVKSSIISRTLQPEDGDKDLKSQGKDRDKDVRSENKGHALVERPSRRRILLDDHNNCNKVTLGPLPCEPRYSRYFFSKQTSPTNGLTHDVTLCGPEQAVARYVHLIQHAVKV